MENANIIAANVLIKGDKFPRTISKIETGEATRNHLISKGFDGQIYMASRNCKRSTRVFHGMAYRNAKTGEYVFA